MYSPNYPKWVKDSWKVRSEAVNGVEIAKCFRYNLNSNDGTYATLDRKGKFVIRQRKSRIRS